MRAARDPVSRRALLAGAVGAAAAGLLGTRPAAAEPAPATKPTTSPARETAIHKLEAFYATIYGEPLASAERLPREIAMATVWYESS